MLRWKQPVEFEWDEAKRLLNLEKHKVDFVDVVAFWESSRLEMVDDRQDYQEERRICYGQLQGRVMALVYTGRKGAIRVISFRKANARERKEYEKAIQK